MGITRPTPAPTGRRRLTDAARSKEGGKDRSSIPSYLISDLPENHAHACRRRSRKGLPSGTPAGLAWRPRGRDPTPGDWNSRPGGRPASSNLSSCNCEVGLGQSDLSTDREDPAAAPASPVPHRTQCTGKPWGPTHHCGEAPGAMSAGIRATARCRSGWFGWMVGKDEPAFVSHHAAMQRRQASTCSRGFPSRTYPSRCRRLRRTRALRPSRTVTFQVLRCGTPRAQGRRRV